MTELVYTNEFTARKWLNGDKRLYRFVSLTYPDKFVLCLGSDYTKPTMGGGSIIGGKRWLAKRYPVEWAAWVLTGRILHGKLLFEINPEDVQ